METTRNEVKLDHNTDGFWILEKRREKTGNNMPETDENGKASKGDMLPLESLKYLETMENLKAVFSL